MVTLPVATPVTSPDVLLAVAMPELLLLHVPPPVASLSVLVPPTVAYNIPEIAGGEINTLTVVIAAHPPLTI